jgi:Cyanophycin synthase-like N-terminal domain
MRIVEILFYDSNKVKLVVEMPDPNRYTTDHVPHLPRSLFKLFPHLAQHKCHNEHGHSFRRESLATEIPHLLEHLIIELQTQAQRHEVLKGETQWNWRVDPRGTFHVHVEYENEQLVLAAIRLAERVINALDRRDIDAIDTDEEIRRLRLLAELGNDLRGQIDPNQPAPEPLALARGRVKGGRTRSGRYVR